MAFATKGGAGGGGSPGWFLEQMKLILRKKVSLKSGRFYSSERVFAVSNNSNLRID